MMHSPTCSAPAVCLSACRWCVVELLSKGYRVRATVRDDTDPERCQFLWDMVRASVLPVAASSLGARARWRRLCL